MNSTIFILGGARSGKSRHAQNLAEALGPRRLFLATAEAHDTEMAVRIARHKQDRGSGWDTLEVPLLLKTALQSLSPDNYDVCLLDCLTLWLSNTMLADLDVDQAIDELAQGLADVPVTLVMVSNEVGMGLVPETPLGRRFRDAQGRLNQTLAGVCDQVEFVAAGLPIRLKG